ncbi:hypothetical protein BaRGS_00022066 [Batillaria attramentaria]|uniref:Uncharacterized protein n=1 Tax=Batillaria attramentaria TaxID=370345 RepID=A0ABD0KI51_9CAEN
MPSVDESEASRRLGYSREVTPIFVGHPQSNRRLERCFFSECVILDDVGEIMIKIGEITGQLPRSEFSLRHWNRLAYLSIVYHNEARRVVLGEIAIG